jgi:phosphoribosylformylglycinamidine synthase
LRASGTNCDVETAFALEHAGAEVELVHVNRLVGRERRLSDYRMLVIPGGFTYGDDLGGGKILANELSIKLGEDISRFVESGGLILGICNGFQVMLKAGILPEPSAAGVQVTMTSNDSGRFECRWVYLGVNWESPCIFTRGMTGMYLPVAHGEGKVVTAGNALDDSSISLYYTDETGGRGAGYPWNPNGSMNDIAGICDKTGRIFALMPHPERHVRSMQHPQWTRLGAGEHGNGMGVFVNAVKWIQEL